MNSIEGGGQLSEARRKILADILRDEKKGPGKARHYQKGVQSAVPYSLPQPRQATPWGYAGPYSPQFQLAPGLGGQQPNPYMAMAPVGMPGLPYQPPRLPISKPPKKVDKSRQGCF